MLGYPRSIFQRSKSPHSSTTIQGFVKDMVEQLQEERTYLIGPGESTNQLTAYVKEKLEGILETARSGTSVQETTKGTEKMVVVQDDRSKANVHHSCHSRKPSGLPRMGMRSSLLPDWPGFDQPISTGYDYRKTKVSYDAQTGNLGLGNNKTSGMRHTQDRKEEEALRRRSKDIRTSQQYYADNTRNRDRAPPLRSWPPEPFIAEPPKFVPRFDPVRSSVDPGTVPPLRYRTTARPIYTYPQTTRGRTTTTRAPYDSGQESTRWRRPVSPLQERSYTYTTTQKERLVGKKDQLVKKKQKVVERKQKSVEKKSNGKPRIRVVYPSSGLKSRKSKEPRLELSRRSEGLTETISKRSRGTSGFLSGAFLSCLAGRY